MQAPVRVTWEQLDAEVAAVTSALGDVCPLQLTLERVIVSRGGVVMACWQVSRGTTTTSLRDAIQVRPGSLLTLPWLDAQWLITVPPLSRRLHCTSCEGSHL